MKSLPANPNLEAVARNFTPRRAGPYELPTGMPGIYAIPRGGPHRGEGRVVRLPDDICRNYGVNPQQLIDMFSRVGVDVVFPVGEGGRVTRKEARGALSDHAREARALARKKRAEKERNERSAGHE